MFVSTDNGAVNLQFVARIARRWAKGGPAVTLFYAADGKIIDTLTGGSFDAEESTASVVAAAPGTIAIVASVVADGDALPSESDVLTYELPIIAWRVTRYGAEPVLPEAPASNERVLIVLPDEQLLAVEDQTYRDLATARAAMLADAQRAWTQRHRARAGTAAA